ncbi:uncharacterized protein LOC107795461 [Nicotiana tabacum]|uniref:RBR-type E3 ubiquitin transferase n=1 Tax=Nicotiana tabacum TaxID=4097 RepID=A0A1S4AAI9_TOBAC
MRSNRSVQIARSCFALSASFHGTLGYGVGNLGIETTLLFACLLSIIIGRGVLSVTTSLNVFKVATLSVAGVMPISATTVEDELMGTRVIIVILGVVPFLATTATDELMGTRVIVFLGSSNLPYVFWLLLLLSCFSFSPCRRFKN